MNQPRALVVEDSMGHALLAEDILTEHGFGVRLAPSLLAGLRQAEQWLQITSKPVPTLVLLDLSLPHERCPLLEGTALAAYLHGAMERGELHPAHLVAISADPTGQRAYEVHLAGAVTLLPKPLTLEQGGLLRSLLELPPTFAPLADATSRFARQTFRRDAERLIQMLRSEAANHGTPTASLPVTWSPSDVRRLLFEPTALLRAEPWRTWIVEQGGIDKVRARLRAMGLREEQHKMMEAVFRHGNNVQAVTKTLSLSKTTYYRRLDPLIGDLTTVLNVWC